MELKCPACTKVTDLAQTQVCPRCACDLSALARILEDAQRLLRLAARALRRRDLAQAHWHAQTSWELVHAPAAARLAFLAAAAQGKTDDLLYWHRRSRTPP
jgi:hypothetical protein